MAKSDSATKALELYGSLREIAFTTKPDAAGFPPESSPPDLVYGAIMEFRQEDINWTLFSSLEAAGRHVHLALYCSSGFMIIGERFPESAFLAGRGFIQRAADHLPDMASASNDNPTPPGDRVRLYALTVGGLATAETSMDALERLRAFSPLVRAGVSVIDEMMAVVSPPTN